MQYSLSLSTRVERVLLKCTFSLLYSLLSTTSSSRAEESRERVEVLSHTSTCTVPYCTRYRYCRQGIPCLLFDLLDRKRAYRSAKKIITTSCFLHRPCILRTFAASPLPCVCIFYLPSLVRFGEILSLTKQASSQHTIPYCSFIPTLVWGRYILLSTSTSMATYRLHLSLAK